MSVVYPSLSGFRAARGIEREDSYDYGVWWRDRRRAVFRLTWVGAQGRDDPGRAGELYLVRLSGPHIGTVTLEVIRDRDSLRAADYADFLFAGTDIDGYVELLCVIPPVPPAEGEHPDETVESILEGWADVCGLEGSSDWVRDRAREALEAGWARDPREEYVDV